MSSPKIVLGLGNPGARYRLTRHNLGFRVIDLLAERAGAGLTVAEELGGRAWTGTAELAGRPAILAKPRTYMNRSGRAAVALCRRFDAAPQDLLVVYDDADLELGRVRIRTQGSAAGHRGVASLIEVLGTDAFPRVKLGVRGDGRPDSELADYVLDEFEADEQPIAQAMVVRAADAVAAIFATDLPTAMNEFNAGSAAPGSERGQENP